MPQFMVPSERLIDRPQVGLSPLRSGSPPAVPRRQAFRAVVERGAETMVNVL
jgi:hypothetical protein